MTVRVGLVAAAVLMAPGALDAQDTRSNRYTLENLGGVFIRAEATDACEEAGVSLAELRANATTTLEGAEVQLLTQETMLETPGLPELRITLECVEGNGAIAYSVSLRVQQAAQMVRDPQVMLPEAVTWYSTGVGIVDAAGAPSAVSKTLADKLEAFGAAWAAANAVDETPGGGQ